MQHAVTLPGGMRAEEEPEGHQYLDEPHTLSGGAARKFQKAVLAEWGMLREGLPSTIWVCGYESRSGPLSK
jgi:hypothetical protein